MASNSSNSSSSRICKYDVFLSFRGTDTRNNFIDHLYNHLIKKGIFVFKDDQTLQKGEFISLQLLQAIRDSRVSIVVFSQNYPHSTWCLDEMVAISDCRRELNRTVIPVFYDVDPSHVRKQIGIFKDDCNSQTKRFKYDLDKVNRWQEAMTELGNLVGFDVRDKPEFTEIGKIVQAVIKTLDHKFSGFANDLVGMQPRIEELEKLLKLSSKYDGFRVLGIWGMGGVGKTTHATVLKMARNFEFIKDITDRNDLCKVAVRVKDKWNAMKDGKEYFEMVVCDAKGDDIFVIVPNDLKMKFEKEIPIVEKNTYSMQNFQVSKNDEKFKVSHHEFKLKFNGGTRVFDVNQHQIAEPQLKFKDFREIICGKFREDFLYDIIGAVDDIGFTQPHAGNKKIQVNFDLRDLSDNVIKCTLWEDYATEFLNFKNTETNTGTTIVCMRYAKVKKEGKYPLNVSNTWSTTTLFINDGLPQIVDFKKRFHEQKFYHNAEVMPLRKLLHMPEETKGSTVVKTLKVKPTKFGWYYLTCFKCPKQAFGDTAPYKCQDGHETQTEILRYKLDVEVEDGNDKATFVLWDRECAQLLGTSAATLRANMVQDGIIDPLDYPKVIDDIGGKTLAVKVKWQPKWKSGSVMAINDSQNVIDDIRSQFPPDEGSNSQVSKLPHNKEVLEDTASVFAESHPTDDNFVIPTIDLSATDEIDPDNLEMKTPPKRSGKELLYSSHNGDGDTEDYIGSKLSSTKLMKIPKKEQLM